MSKPRVHVTGRLPVEVERALAEAFELHDSPEGADGIVSLLTTHVDAALLDRAGPQLRIVANYAVGVNNVELEEASRRGLVVSNTPDVLTRATAELPWGFAARCGGREGDRFVRLGEDGRSRSSSCWTGFSRANAARRRGRQDRSGDSLLASALARADVRGRQTLESLLAGPTS